tara:strand:+ start:118 stop:489 length:372 start_codon:yes stop_codon:yes gene_type:complete
MVVGAFVLLGPYVGGLVVWLMLAVDSFGGLARPLTIKDVLGFPFAGLIGYPFGAIPAAVTGLIGGALSASIRSKPLWIVLVTALGGLVSGMILGWSLLFMLPGVIGAFVAGLLALQVRPRWRN